jgi:hypothetical protein
LTEVTYKALHPGAGVRLDKTLQRRIQTTRERYGVDSFVESEASPEMFKSTSRERYGTDHPMQSEEVKERHAGAMLVAHGVRSPFLSPGIQKKAYETNLRNHGGRHSQQCPEVLAKARATWMEKYGVDNPSKCDEIKARIKAVWLAKYGVPFPPQSLWTNRHQSFPNKLEQQVDDLSPVSVVYAGDGSYWVKYAGASKARNPDFVVLKRDQLRAYQAGAELNGLRTSATIEVFGDYWHGPSKTGVSRATHRAQVKAYYARCGIACLVLWEREIKEHPRRVGERIRRFLTKWRQGAYRGIRETTPPVSSVIDLFGV